MSTHASIMLAKIEAILEGTADVSTRRTRLGDKELEKWPVGDLLKLRATYRSEVALETAAAANTGSTTPLGAPVVFFGRSMP